MTALGAVAPPGHGTPIGEPGWLLASLDSEWRAHACGRFASRAKVDGTYMFCRQESVLQAARFLSKVDGLSLQVRTRF